MRYSDTRNMIILTLLIAGDIQSNPGPINKNISVYPCGLCELPVSWNCQAVCCDGCDVWLHKSCIELCSTDFELLQRSNVQWMCCRCDSINVDTFTFHSYDLDPNYYSPIQDQNITLESVSSVFSPLKASSPRDRKNSDRTRSVHDSVSKSHSQSSYSLPKVPTKKNLRILNVNCRSIKDKSAEFTAALSYLKPDVVCGTESWLSGCKPGCNPTQDAIKSSEVFPSDYIAYHNDRGTLGGGVFVLVKQDIIAMEQPQFTTSCEIEWVKAKLKGNKDLYIGSFYMPHRDVNTLKELEKSLELVTAGDNKHVILCGDFNCPDIDWNTHSVNPNGTDKQTQQMLIDITQRFKPEPGSRSAYKRGKHSGYCVYYHPIITEIVGKYTRYLRPRHCCVRFPY